MIIDVTQNDINNGVKFNTLKNPIANALKRIFNVSGVYVDKFNIEISHQTKGFIMPLTKSSVECQKFMEDFYSNREVKPFSFELELEQDTQTNV